MLVWHGQSVKETTLARSSWAMHADNRYRTVPESKVIDFLVLAGWAHAGANEDVSKHAGNALRRSVELGVKYQLSKAGDRLFDPVEVINQLKWSGRNGLDRFWIDHFVETERSRVSQFAGQDAEMFGPDALRFLRFEVSLIRSFDLSVFAPGTKVLLRLPLPYASDLTRDVQAVVSEAASSSFAVTKHAERLDIRLEVPRQQSIEIATRISFATRGVEGLPATGRLDTKQSEIYLREKEGLIHVSPAVSARARSFVTGDDWKTASALWNFLLAEFTCGMIHYDRIAAQAPGDWVLDSSWYDCQLGAALFVSMCRSCGIPSRLLSGYLLYQFTPTFHYWAEVWIEGRGWVPFDFLCWDLSQGGQENRWRDYFRGQLDYRMVTQCMPLIFTGPMSTKFPPAWHMIATRAGEGVEVCFQELGGRLIYRDRVAVLGSREP